MAFKKFVIEFLVLSFLIIAALSFLIGWFSYIEYSESKQYTPQCIELGYKEYMQVGGPYNSEDYCVDRDGIFHRVMLSSGELIEVKTN